MTKPVRVQRKRTKGFNLQLASPNGLPVVYVGRPSVFGNPFPWSKDTFASRERAAQHFRLWWENRGNPKHYLFGMFPERMDRLMKAMFQTEPHPLRGKNLACWCKLDETCHGDVLLLIANK